MADSPEVPGARLLDLVQIMDTLRVSCPWDRQQTHESLLKYLLEEAYEAADAIESGNYAAMCEELGDVLFQVYFHARVASERPAAEGGFTIDDVASALAAKLIRRHPHVFGSVTVTSADEVNANWEEIKKAERAAAASGPTSVLDGVPFGQPALSLAAQLQRRAERAGLMETVDDSEEAAVSSGADVDGLNGERLGRELMTIVARARSAGLDPELELRAAARRFADRVRSREQSRD